MSLFHILRKRVKAARNRAATWVRLLDTARLLLTAAGRSVLWTRFFYRSEVHQTTAFTCENRYPELFDLAAELAPAAERVLSFGCSTGEELVSLRRRFPRATLVGAEINSRSRRCAARRMQSDAQTIVVDPDHIDGSFDLVFALAVLQREPHKIIEMQVQDLSPYYPYERFDAAVRQLGGVLRSGGLLCVMHAHYRIEDSSVAEQFEPITISPLMTEPLFRPDGLLLEGAIAYTIFRKLSSPKTSSPRSAGLTEAVAARL